MKKSKLTTFTVLVLIITMASLIMVSGTYAKYTSEATGTDTATVAKWSIKVNDTDIATESVTFGLFDTIYDLEDDESVSSSTETDVNSTLIAPGTGGKFALVISNASEVTASYEITLEETSNTSGVPIEYSTDGSTWSKATGISVSNDSFAVGDSDETVTVYWRWAFDGNNNSNYTQTDETDTALGTASTAPTVEITATITATQVN